MAKYKMTRVKIKNKAKSALLMQMRLSITAALSVVALQLFLTLISNYWYPVMPIDVSANLPVSMLIGAIGSFSAQQVGIIILLETAAILLAAPFYIGLAGLFLSMARSPVKYPQPPKFSEIFSWYTKMERSMKAFTLWLTLKILSTALYAAAVAGPAYMMYRIEKQASDAKYILDTSYAGTYALYMLAAGLLLLVAGVIAQAWMPATYILAQNPEMGALRAIGRAIRLMRGHKLEYLIFRISFITWYIGVFFTFGLLLFYLIPYQNLSEAMFVRNLQFEQTGREESVGLEE